jgi:hypothetical protein
VIPKANPRLDAASQRNTRVKLKSSHGAARLKIKTTEELKENNAEVANPNPFEELKDISPGKLLEKV